LKKPIRARLLNDLVELDRRTINAAVVAKLLLPAGALFFFREDVPLRLGKPLFAWNGRSGGRRRTVKA
jgi:hypothetical protein